MAFDTQIAGKILANSRPLSYISKTYLLFHERSDFWLAEFPVQFLEA